MGLLNPTPEVQFEVNMPVQLLMELPHPHPSTLRIDGRVRHTTQSALGVQFTNIEPEDFEGLAKYLADLLKLEAA